MHLRSRADPSTSEAHATTMEEQSSADTYSNNAENGSSSNSDTTSRSPTLDSLENGNSSSTAVVHDNEDEYAHQSQQVHSQGVSSSSQSTNPMTASSQSPHLPPPPAPTPPPHPLSYYPPYYSPHYQPTQPDYQPTLPRTYRPILPRPTNLPITTVFGTSVASSSSAPAAPPTQTDGADDPWSPHNPPDTASRQQRITQNAPGVAVGDRNWGYKDKMERELEEMASRESSKEGEGSAGKKRRRDDGTEDDVPEGHDSRRRREDKDPENEGGAGMSTRDDA
ncbi:hypothetical protein ACMFMG_005597 [Clarireedia jacksonii]